MVLTGLMSRVAGNFLKKKTETIVQILKTNLKPINLSNPDANSTKNVSSLTCPRQRNF